MPKKSVLKSARGKMEKGSIELFSYPTELINQLNDALSKLNFDKALKLINNEENREKILKNYQSVIQDVIWVHLTDSNYEEEPKLYDACECLLIALAEHCHQDRAFIFELLEFIEERSSGENDNQFTSVLKALQVLLLKHNDRAHNTLNTALNAIEDYMHKIKLPTLLEKKCLEEEEEKLLENDDSIRRILMVYITLDLFYQPIVEALMPKNENFEESKQHRRNILFCFILRLLGKPLAYLDLTIEEGKVMSYSREVAENLVKSLCVLKPNFFNLLEVVEERIRWSARGKVNENVKAILYHPDKTPITQLGILFYLVISENICIDKIPKVYSPEYLLKIGLYLVDSMLNDENESVKYKGLKLCSKLLENSHDQLER